MKKILVGVDFHEETRELIDTAVKFAKPFNSKIYLLHAASPEPDFVGYAVGPQYIRDFRADELRNEHRLLMNYADELKQKGFEAEGLLIEGEAIRVVLEESEKLKIDLIIFGHHDHGFLYNAFFGSHATDILKKSKIPVLVVPFRD